MIQHAGVLGSIDLGLQDLLGTGNGQGSNLQTQGIAGTGNFLLDVGAGLGQDALGFGRSLGLDLFSNLTGTAVGLFDQCGSLLLGSLQFLGNLFEFFLARRNARKAAGEKRERLTVVGATSGDTGRYVSSSSSMHTCLIHCVA